MLTSEGPVTSSVPGAVETTAARSAAERPTAWLSRFAHGSAWSPSGKLVQKIMASASCGPAVDLLIEMLPNLSQPTDGTRNENATPSTVSACLPVRRASLPPPAAAVWLAVSPPANTSSTVTQTESWAKTMSVGVPPT